ncbi:MAG TPA: hypothetical protein PKY59_18045 [Pyrinomonadaceae bacterium]|nr:hypothetical protein [Pyrinomonadaceae bacterium]
MELINDSNEKLTIINPKYLTQSTSKNFALTEADCKAENYFFNSSHSSHEPIVSKDFNELIEKILDEKPIDDLVFSLGLNEKLKFKERIFLEFDAHEKKKRWEEITWNELCKKTNQAWFRYSYFLTEDFTLLKPKLIENFSDEFNRAGQIPIIVAGESSYFSPIKTEPIIIDFKKSS